VTAKNWLCYVQTKTMDPQHKPYDFILTNQPKKRLMSHFGATSRRQRILQVVIGGLVILILFIVILDIISKAGRGNTVQLYQVAAAQQDMIAITRIGVANCQSQQFINQSATAQQVITTQANNLTAYLVSIGLKNTTKQVSRYLNTQDEKTLNNDINSGLFNDAYLTIYTNQLNFYRSGLQIAYGDTKKQVLKNQLANDYAALGDLNISGN
jgi:hypothetical protein